MSASMSRCRWLLLALALSASACGDNRQPLFGENITGITFEFYDETEGVFPSRVVLSNPRNPFRDYPISDDMKFDILANGGNAGAFYAWATLLARQPTGEHQYYTAVKLRDIYNAREVEGADREKVRQMAIAGFQAVLDFFPDSVTFDVTATQMFRVATPALLGILDLNGDVEGDWVLVPDENGDPVAIKGSGTVRGAT
jgi:hypothetical protein